MIVKHSDKFRILVRVFTVLVIVSVLISIGTEYAGAQCSMCTLNAEQSVQGENTQGKGLNNGILFLLAMPYIAVAVLGYLWYKKYRKEKTEEENPIRLH